MSKADPISFIHSGDMGDLVAGMGAVKQVCEREHAKARLILDATGGFHQGFLDECVGRMSRTGNKFNLTSAEFLKPLLERQPYVDSVEICDGGTPPNYRINLNVFRNYFADMRTMPIHRQNLLFLHQLAVNVPVGWYGPWLECDTKAKTDLTLFARSNRYQSAHTMIQAILAGSRASGPIAFVGTELEYRSFQDCFRLTENDIPRIPVDNALQMADLIGSSRAIVVNGTCAYWIALGLGVTPIVHEWAVDIDTTAFFSDPAPDVTYIRGGHFVRPKPDGRSNPRQAEPPTNTAQARHK